MLFKELKKNEKQAFYVIIIFYILFLLFRIFSNTFYLVDSYEYLDVAKKIYNLSFLSSKAPDELTTKRPFIYPLFLSLFYGLPILVTILFQTLIGVFSFYLLFKIIKKFEIHIKTKYILFFIFTPSIFIYTQLIMSEWLVMFFLILLFWLLIQKWSTKNFAFIQILTILLAFTKPIFYPIIYLNLVFFAIYFIKKKRFSFWLFIPLIALQSYMFFNKSETGYKHFSSIENINLINFNLYYFKCKTESEPKAKVWLDSVHNIADKKTNFAEKNIYLKNIAKNEIKQHLFKYSFYHFYTSIRGIFDPGRFDTMTFFKKEDGKQGFLQILNTKKPIMDLLKNKFVFVYILLIPIFLINLIKWFYFFKYLLIKKLDFKIYYIITVLVCYILISGPVNSSRYMMPFQAIIIVFAILGISSKKTTKDKISNLIPKRIH